MEKQKITMELSEGLFEIIKEAFDIELELLQGEVIHANGMYKCKIEVSGAKKEMFQDFLKMLIAYPSDQVSVNYFGSRINPN